MRCFIAIELPDDVRERLAALQQRLAPLGKAVRWTRPEQMHLTVKFFEHTPRAQIAAVCEAARAIAQRHPAFDLDIRGTGCFPPRGAVRVVWAGIPDLPQPLLDCQHDCEDTFAGMGFAKENRSYSPHLTLGRVSDASASHRIRDALRACETFRGGAFTATELVVFQSEPGRGGHVHTPLDHAPFGQ